MIFTIVCLCVVMFGLLLWATEAWGRIKTLEGKLEVQRDLWRLGVDAENNLRKDLAQLRQRLNTQSSALDGLQELQMRLAANVGDLSADFTIALLEKKL